MVATPQTVLNPARARRGFQGHPGPLARVRHAPPDPVRPRAHRLLNRTRGRYEEYHPYGSTAWWARKNAIGVSLKRYKYTGMERDDETGLSRHGVRMYAGWLGRWASADPSGMKDGVNRYAYVRGNPIRGVDGTGRATLFDLTKEYANAALPAFGETLAAPFVAIGSASTQIAGAYAETYEKATTEGLVAAGQHAASTTAKNYVAGVKSVPGIAYASTVGLAQEVGTSAGNVTAAYIQLAVGDDQGALESARAAGESGGKVAGVAALTAATVGAVKGTARALAEAPAEVRAPPGEPALPGLFDLNTSARLIDVEARPGSAALQSRALLAEQPFETLVAGETPPVYGPFYRSGDPRVEAGGPRELWGTG